MPRGTERAGLESIDGPGILERTVAKRPTQIPGRVRGKKSRRPEERMHRMVGAKKDIRGHRTTDHQTQRHSV